MEKRLSENLKSIYKKIAHAAMKAGREPNEVKLIGVTKGVDTEAMKKAIEAGLRNLGENRVQEFRGKFDILKSELDFSVPSCAKGKKGYRVCWHLIGHLQKNKAKTAVELFDWIHSVDSVDLAVALNRHAESFSKKQKVLIQVKLSDEESKYGIIKDNFSDAISVIADMKNLSVEGLMTIPPYFEVSEKVRPFFRELREIRDRAVAKGFRLPELSMGMSNDFEVAIEEGATMVRVGTAIFGERKKEAA